MNLEEAISHCDDIIKNCNNNECKIDHKQLKGWLIELKNFRKLKKHYEKN